MVQSLKHNTSIINKQDNGDNKIIIHSFLLALKELLGQNWEMRPKIPFKWVEGFI